MKRRLANVALFLLLGAIVNVVVAWGDNVRDSAIDHARYQARSNPTFLRNLSNTELAEELIRELEIKRSGFPCDSMTYNPWAAWLAYDGERGSQITWQGGILVPQGSWSSTTFAVHLSLSPIWPGFAINTVLYAATLWVMLAARGRVRRWRRIKRGWCPACAYPVGESATCTECGKAIPFPLRGRAREGVESAP